LDSQGVGAFPLLHVKCQHFVWSCADYVGHGQATKRCMLFFRALAWIRIKYCVNNHRANDRRPTSRPRVTVAIPTYNRADTTLPATLRSAIAQTYANLDIVVSDNCSSDGTEALVRGYGSRVRYVRQPENLGLNGNLNACVDLAAGDYVLVLHDDDLIDPDFVESCMDVVGDSISFGLIRTGMRIITADGAVALERPNRATTSTSMADLMFAWFRGETAQYCCNTLYNTRALRAAGGFQSRHNLFQDALAQVKVASAQGHAHVAGVKASWRRHDGNAGSAARARLANWCQDSLEVMDTICRLEPVRAPALRREGMRFFSRMNYLRAQQIPSLTERLSGYLLVARAFGFVESPLNRIYRNEIRPHLRVAKRRVIQGLSKQPT
jgi:glycosyltransferase involved in cell wall biosynthesis